MNNFKPRQLVVAMWGDAQPEENSMNQRTARFIIRLTVSGWLPRIVGRRKFWHRLYDRASMIVLRAWEQRSCATH